MLQSNHNSQESLNSHGSQSYTDTFMGKSSGIRYCKLDIIVKFIRQHLLDLKINYNALFPSS